MTNSLEDEVQRVLASMDEKQNGQEQDIQANTGQGKEAEETIHIHYFPDAIVILKEGEETPQPEQVVDSAPARHKPDSLAFLPVCVFLLLLFSTLSFQFYCIFNPPIATVTIFPTSQTVTLTGTVQVGRVLAPLTIAQSQSSPTTGRGHQDARAAWGTVTFYNGQQTAQIEAAGTVYTGTDGVAIETTQSATIPPGSPATGYGTVTVTAQAVEAGNKGNIQPGDVNTPIGIAVFVKNSQFTGGQDERDFQTVTARDIAHLAAPLKTAVTRSMSGALHGQLTPDEQLAALPCTPNTASNHATGQEATTVTVSVSETCSAVAYSTEALATQAAVLLSQRATRTVGPAYSLIGAVQVQVKQATVTSTAKPLAYISFTVSGTWVYGLSVSSQQQIKHLLAGKTVPEAQRLLATLPGIERASIHISGFTDETTLPKDQSRIRLLLFIAG